MVWRRCLASGGARRALWVLGVLVLTAGCTESTTQPVSPSSLPADKVQALALACPAAAQVESRTGGPERVTFDLPAPRGGLAPVAITCTPPSGSSFAIGSHRVTCEGTDQLGLTASCRFRVTVFRRSELNRILAFGDSLTAGVGVAPAQAYPAVLQALLRHRYGAQPITVTNEGIPGERAIVALPRLDAALRQHDPHAVLLMQGTNDLVPGQGDAAAEVIRSMAVHARNQQNDPIIATVPPLGSGLVGADRVEPYNERLRQIAAGEGIPLVDVHRIISEGRCTDGPALPEEGSFPCLLADGVHLTPQGNALVARGFFDRLVALYERNGPGGQLQLTHGGR